MTIAWSQFWFWWLFSVLVTFGIPELWSIYRDHGKMTWTLSDCIRRWASVHKWLPPVVWGVSILLLVHWFGSP
jgi:hypothetical protein